MPPARQTILVVEDEAAIAETITYALSTEGFAPVWKTTGRAALAVLAAQPVALVVLDVGLPDMSGLDVCRELRQRYAVPVIFLTARSSEVDKIVGLELGADDYLAKPFSPRELTARIRAVLRRSHGVVAGTAPGGWTHDEAKCRITFHGKALDLTRNEYRLLGALLATPGPGVQPRPAHDRGVGRPRRGVRPHGGRAYQDAPRQAPRRRARSRSDRDASRAGLFTPGTMTGVESLKMKVESRTWQIAHASGCTAGPVGFIHLSTFTFQLGLTP